MKKIKNASKIIVCFLVCAVGFMACSDKKNEVLLRAGKGGMSKASVEESQLLSFKKQIKALVEKEDADVNSIIDVVARRFARTLRGEPQEKIKAPRQYFDWGLVAPGSDQSTQAQASVKEKVEQKSKFSNLFLEMKNKDSQNMEIRADFIFGAKVASFNGTFKQDSEVHDLEGQGNVFVRHMCLDGACTVHLLLHMKKDLTNVEPYLLFELNAEGISAFQSANEVLSKQMVVTAATEKINGTLVSDVVKFQGKWAEPFEFIVTQSDNDQDNGNIIHAKVTEASGVKYLHLVDESEDTKKISYKFKILKDFNLF